MAVYVSLESLLVTSNGGSGDDQIRLTVNTAMRVNSLSVSGGSGNDTIKISETTTGKLIATSEYGFSSVSVDAGADDDTITVEGSLNTTITTDGSDTVVLTRVNTAPSCRVSGRFTQKLNVTARRC